MKTDRRLIYKLLLGAVIIMIAYLGYSNGKCEEKDCESIDNDGHVIETNYAKTENVTEEDSVDIAYLHFHINDEALRKMNEQIYHAMTADGILEDDGYADRAETKYDAPYADDRKESASAEDLGSQASVGEADEAEGAVFGETYSLERSEGLFFQVKIDFPQLKNTINGNTEKANELLKDAAFSIQGKTADAAIALLEEEIQNPDCFDAIDVDYEILRLDENCISVVYEIYSYTGGASPHTHHYMTTIDIGKGEYIELRDLTSVEQLTETLRAGNFEVYTGTYSEFRDEDAHEREVIEGFIEALKEKLSEEPTESGFDRFSSQNIGLDEKNIYVSFPYAISLDGYFILGVPLEAVGF